MNSNVNNNSAISPCEVDEKMMLVKFKQFVDEITAQSGRNYKISILEKYKDDEDIKYLLSNCERYKLEPINFRYIDLREILRHLTGKKPNSLSYEYIRYLHVPDSGANRSDIDAEMTMLVLKEALWKSKKTLDDILED